MRKNVENAKTVEEEGTEGGILKRAKLFIANNSNFFLRQIVIVMINQKVGFLLCRVMFTTHVLLRCCILCCILHNDAAMHNNCIDKNFLGNFGDFGFR